MDAPALAAEMTDPSAAGIAGTVGRLISEGRLRPGERLPTVRDLAAELGVSPATVSQAWRRLGASGLLESRRRLGTVVRASAPARDGQRYRLLNRDPGSAALDLSVGTPDPALLPDLRPALARMADQRASGSYFRPAALPELIELLRGDWPFPPEDLSIFSGATDAMDHLLASTLRFGDRVIVGNPGFPSTFDLLDRYGAEAVPVRVGAEGFDLEEFEAAVATHDPRFVIVQPRAQNPSGHGLSRQRAGALASMLARRSTVIIEDDHDGAIANAPAVSLGEWLPAQTVLIRSFSKSHGPDLRIAAVGGAHDLVDAAVRRRHLGAGWTSLLLQSLVLDLLTSPESVAAVERARRTYAERRTALLDALRARGIAGVGNDGIHVWVPVLDEREALVSLAVHGIVVSPGSAFCPAPLDTDHLRVTISRMPLTEADRVADALAQVKPPATGRFRA